MGIFDSMFKQQDKPLWPGVAIQSKANLEELIADSFTRPQLIFKHSTRCSISRYVLADFISHFSYSSAEFASHYLDLLNFREVSSKLSEVFQVIHQSPQLLVIKNGISVNDESHYEIIKVNLSKYI